MRNMFAKIIDINYVLTYQLQLGFHFLQHQYLWLQIDDVVILFLVLKLIENLCKIIRINILNYRCQEMSLDSEPVQAILQPWVKL